MERYDPERLELSARDRVALANYTEIAEGRGTEHGGVLLDVSHLDRDVILDRLPRMYRQFVDLAMLDITKTPMEVAPTAHYSMGGVRVDAETHATDVEGLYAVGECATGVHGANRLGGNSLAECLVFGRDRRRRGRALVGGARRAGARPRRDRRRARGGRRAARPPRRGVRAAAAAGGTRPHVRVLRRRPLRGRPARGAHAPDRGRRAHARDLEVRPDIAGYADLAHAFDLHGSLLAARATLECALERRETRGAHNRGDFPDQDPGLQVNLCGRRRDARATTGPFFRLPSPAASRTRSWSAMDRLLE